LIKKILGILAFYLPPPFTKYVHKYRGVKIRDMGSLFIGTNVHIDHVYPELITIGSNVTIASGTRVTAHSTPPLAMQSVFPAVKSPIIICNNVYIGADSIILPGVTIHDWTVIGAGSVVTKDVRRSTIVAGNPAKEIGLINSNSPVTALSDEGIKE
jgi:acetyltransferase-like isoleucine patch superfamily enzyme